MRRDDSRKKQKTFTENPFNPLPTFDLTIRHDVDCMEWSQEPYTAGTGC